MEFVGEHLKKIRLKKNINLKSVAEELNIQLYLLERIENNDFSDHLNLVYLIALIRAYSKFLGLNDNEVIKRFKDQNLIDKEDLIDELPKPLENSNFYFAIKTFSVFSIILISFSFYFLFIKTRILPALPVVRAKLSATEYEYSSTLLISLLNTTWFCLSRS